MELTVAEPRPTGLAEWDGDWTRGGGWNGNRTEGMGGRNKKRRPDWGRLFNDIEETFSCYFMTLMVEVLPSV